MNPNEFGKRCQKCHKTGGETFARVYYRQIDGKWLRLCASCWKIEEATKEEVELLTVTTDVVEEVFYHG